MKDQNSLTFKNLLLLVALGILFYVFINHPNAFPWLRKVLMPVVSAFVMAYLLNPLVNFIKRHSSLSHTSSVLVTTCLVLAFLGLGLTFLIPTLTSSITTLVASMPSLDEIEKLINDILESVDKIDFIPLPNIKLDGMLTQLLSKFSSFAGTFFSSILTNIFNITSFFMKFIISFFIAIYMLLEREDLKARIKRILHAYNDSTKADNLIHTAVRAHEIFINFFIGKIIDSIIIGFITFVILMLMGYKFPLIIALIIGITNVIPYFGPYIGAVPAVFISLLTDGYPLGPLLALIIFLIQQFDGLYLGPKILGDKVGVNAFWVLTSVTVGGAMFGVWGMLLGVPVFVFLKTALEENVEKKLAQKNMSNYQKDKIKDPTKKKKTKAPRRKGPKKK